MQKLQYEQVRYANGFVPATTTLSHGQRSKCADLLNSYLPHDYLAKVFTVFPHSRVYTGLPHGKVYTATSRLGSISRDARKKKTPA